MDKAKTKKTVGIIVDIAMYGLLLAQMLYVFTGNTVHGAYNHKAEMVRNAV